MYVLHSTYYLYQSMLYFSRYPGTCYQSMLYFSRYPGTCISLCYTSVGILVLVSVYVIGILVLVSVYVILQ